VRDPSRVNEHVDDAGLRGRVVIVVGNGAAPEQLRER
jgi:hypothetical protein